METRKQQLEQWLQQTLAPQQFDLKKLAGDASFRQYYRVQLPENSFIVMDAPPEREDCSSFIRIAQLFEKNGINVPTIHQSDLIQGFLLLRDFGDELYFNVINDQNAEQLYEIAFQNLLKIQQCNEVFSWPLPSFDDKFIHMELTRTREWYFQRYLQRDLSDVEQKILANTFQFLSDRAAEQPKVCVHRDYHSRNLMVLPQQGLGILDFQDAVLGPVTYDLLSLLRDCYLTWPSERVVDWALHYRELALDAGIIQHVSAEQFIEWFDFLSVQRHMKCLGIFSRLFLAYEKPSYQKDIAPTLRYVVNISSRYPALKSFHELMSEQLSHVQ